MLPWHPFSVMTLTIPDRPPSLHSWAVNFPRAPTILYFCHCSVSEQMDAEFILIILRTLIPDFGDRGPTLYICHTFASPFSVSIEYFTAPSTVGQSRQWSLLLLFNPVELYVYIFYKPCHAAFQLLA